MEWTCLLWNDSSRVSHVKIFLQKKYFRLQIQSKKEIQITKTKKDNYPLNPITIPLFPLIGIVTSYLSLRSMKADIPRNDPIPYNHAP